MWVPSASGPGLRSDVVGAQSHVSVDFSLDGTVGVEKSDVNESSSGQIPGHGSEVSLVQVVAVSESSNIWVILVSSLGEESLLQVEEPDSIWGNSEVVHHDEVGIESSGSLSDTDLQVGEIDKFGVYQVIQFRASWFSFHDVEFWVFIGERNGWNHISSQVNHEDENSGQWKWELEADESDERRNFWDVRGKSVSNRFLEVIENKSSFFNTIDNRTEVVIKQKHIGGILSNI